ncbi:MAG: hypothetical protein AAFR61_04640 [Bacteroidota bacterium]
MPTSPHVLVAALDWGLGHATRMVPIIHVLRELGLRVHLAGSGHSLVFLRNQFPDLPYLELPAYRVRYSKGARQGGAILRQVPRLIRVIHQEKKVLRRYAEDHDLAAVISDNRYGLHLPGRLSVFVTHQLYPLSPWSWLQPLVNFLHQRAMRPFDEIWVPDVATAPGFSGKLSHPAPSARITYIGLLSRFMLPEYQLSKDREEKNGAYMLAILSGPEPQRSMWEEQILLQAKAAAIPTLLARGKPAELAEDPGPLIQTRSWVDGNTLAELIAGADLLVSRPGYSSLMDYTFLPIPPLLLVPTPGQTEQEYLGAQWKGKSAILMQDQSRFELKMAWDNRRHQGERSSLLKPEDQLKKLTTTLTDFISRLRKYG